MRLRALEGHPLDDAQVRETVLATARAIAERTGFALEQLDAAHDAVTVTMRADKLAALGFLAELRRVTNAWYESKYHRGPLWVARHADGSGWPGSGDPEA